MSAVSRPTAKSSKSSTVEGKASKSAKGKSAKADKSGKANHHLMEWNVAADHEKNDGAYRGRFGRGDGGSGSKWEVVVLVGSFVLWFG